jgi:hemerythrin-like metal-binding protein
MFLQINEEEHRAIYAIIDRLEEAVAHPPITIVRELLTIIEQHFKHEEAWMVKYNYQDYAAHKQAHEAYLSLLYNFYRDSQQDPSIITDRLAMIKAALDSHKDTEMIAFSVHVAENPPSNE